MLGLPASGEDMSLKGIRGVMVVVEDLSEGTLKLGLTKEAIRTDVELKLRLAGIRILAANPGEPYLYINVNVLPSGAVANVSVALTQPVKLIRDPGIEVLADTWGHEILITHPTTREIRSATKDLVDQFLNAWLSVNPK